MDAGDVGADDLARMIADRISSMQVELRETWNGETELPTRFFILDDVLPEEIAQAIRDAFPSNADGFHVLDSFRERKRTMAKLSQSDPMLRAISVAFQHPSVIGAVADITGMKELEGDRSFYAGGLSMMMPGDFLNPHVDNSHDGVRERYRRINILYYLNPGWSEESGGNLELWDGDVTSPTTIVSAFNRLVVMETHKTSWHSVSKVSGERPRLCVSNYYFSRESPDNTNYFHVTSFTGRPGEFFRRMFGPLDNMLRYVVLRLVKGWVPGKSRADSVDSM